MAVIWNEIRLRQDSVDCWSPFVDNIGGVWWTTWSDLDFDFPKCVKKKNWQTISSLVVGRLVPLRHRTTSVKSISSIVIIVYRWFSRTCYNVVMLSFTQRWSTLDSVNTKLCSRSFVIWNNSSTKKNSMYLLEWEKTPTSWNGEGGDHGESGSMQKVKIERQQPVSIQECLRPRCNSSIGDKESVATSKKGEVLLSQVNRVKRLVKQAQ